MAELLVLPELLSVVRGDEQGQRTRQGPLQRSEQAIELAVEVGELGAVGGLEFRAALACRLAAGQIGLVGIEVVEIEEQAAVALPLLEPAFDRAPDAAGAGIGIGLELVEEIEALGEAGAPAHRADVGDEGSGLPTEIPEDFRQGVVHRHQGIVDVPCPVLLRQPAGEERGH